MQVIADILLLRLFFYKLTCSSNDILQTHIQLLKRWSRAYSSVFKMIIHIYIYIYINIYIGKYNYILVDKLEFAENCNKINLADRQ